MCLGARRARFCSSLGPSRAHFGRPLAGFWPVLGGSRAPLAASWAALGSFVGARGRPVPCRGRFGDDFLPPQVHPNLDFGEFGACRPGCGQALELCLDMPFAVPLAFLFLVVTLLVVGDCNAFLDTCLHPLHNILDTMLALWHIMLLFVQ